MRGSDHWVFGLVGLSRVSDRHPSGFFGKWNDWGKFKSRTHGLWVFGVVQIGNQGSDGGRGVESMGCSDRLLQRSRS